MHTIQMNTTANVELTPWLIASIYTTLFIIGVGGNCWVLCIMTRIYRFLIPVIHRHAIFIYISALSVVDLSMYLLP